MKSMQANGFPKIQFCHRQMLMFAEKKTLVDEPRRKVMAGNKGRPLWGDPLAESWCKFEANLLAAIKSFFLPCHSLEISHGAQLKKRQEWASRFSCVMFSL